MHATRFLIALSASILPLHDPCQATDRMFVDFQPIFGIDRIDLDTGNRIPFLALLQFPYAAICSPDGILYFGEFPLVRRFDQDCNQLDPIRLPPAVGDGTPGLSVDFSGDLYISGQSGPCCGEDIWRVDAGDPRNVPVMVIPRPAGGPAGESAIVGGGPLAGALLFIAGDRTVYISEPPGSAARVFIDRSEFPGAVPLLGVASNPCGEVFVSHFAIGYYIARFDPEGKRMGNLVEPTLAHEIFEIEFDSVGNLYFSDPSRGGIWKVAPDRTISTLVDYPTSSGMGPFAICQEPLRADAGGPYAVECAGERTCVALAASPQRPCMDFSWVSDCPAADFGGSEASATPTLCFATAGCATECTATLKVREGQRFASAAAAIRVEDTRPPALLGVPAHADVECDAVPPPPAVTARDDCDPGPSLVFKEDRIPGSCPGNYLLERSWQASDACGNTGRELQRLAVHDIRSPDVVESQADVHVLWPPDHRYECFAPGDFRPDISDSCSPPLTWSFSGCASDQPDDAREDGSEAWAGDGHTSQDCVVRDSGREICVRAERAGTGPGAPLGRRYTVSIRARDACGNVSGPAAIGRIHVPHDRGRN